MEIHLCPLNILHGNYQRWHEIYNDIRILAIFCCYTESHFWPWIPPRPHLAPSLTSWSLPLMDQVSTPELAAEIPSNGKERVVWMTVFLCFFSCGIKLRTIMAADSKIFHSLPVWIKNHMWMLRGKALILQENWSCVMSLNNATKKRGTAEMDWKI